MEWLRPCSWPTRQANMTAAMFPFLPSQSLLSEIVAEFHVEKVQPEIVLIKTSSSSIGRQSRHLEDDATKERLQSVQSSARFSRRICHDLFILINGHAIYLANSCDVLLPAICTLLALSHRAASRLRNLCEFNGSQQIDWHFYVPITCCRSAAPQNISICISIDSTPQLKRELPTPVVEGETHEIKSRRMLQRQLRPQTKRRTPFADKVRVAPAEVVNVSVSVSESVSVAVAVCNSCTHLGTI